MGKKSNQSYSCCSMIDTIDNVSDFDGKIQMENKIDIIIISLTITKIKKKKLIHLAINQFFNHITISISIHIHTRARVSANPPKLQ